MAKRFTDTEKFNDPWYRRLSPKHKCLWEYLLSQCNHAGILQNLDFDMMTFQIGEEITKDDLKIFENRIKFINDEILFISKFIEFQYGKLNPENRVHSSVLRELKKYSLDGVIKGLISPILGLKDKDKNKDKDKENISSSLVLSSSLQNDQKLYGKYNNVCMSVQQYGQLLSMCASQKLLDELVDSLSENIEQGKEHPFRSDFPNTHFVRIQKYRKYRLENPNRFQLKETAGFDINEWVKSKTKELETNECL